MYLGSVMVTLELFLTSNDSKIRIIITIIIILYTVYIASYLMCNEVAQRRLTNIF